MNKNLLWVAAAALVLVGMTTWAILIRRPPLAPGGGPTPVGTSVSTPCGPILISIASSLTKRIVEGEELSALMIDQEAERGDPLSNEIVLETARFLGIGVVTAMHSVDPQGVVIGGAMTFGKHEAMIGRN